MVLHEYISASMSAIDLTVNSKATAVNIVNPNMQSMATALSMAATDTTSKTTTACDAALNTPELLEAIISFLPDRDIMAKAQRVSRTWKNAIARSPGINKILWLTPRAGKATHVTTHSSMQVNLSGSFNAYRSYHFRDVPVYP
jgi:hypothetical protein